jgi:hypothetical protein
VQNWAAPGKLKPGRQTCEQFAVPDRLTLHLTTLTHLPHRDDVGGTTAHVTLGRGSARTGFRVVTIPQRKQNVALPGQQEA